MSSHAAVWLGEAIHDVFASGPRKLAAFAPAAPGPRSEVQCASGMATRRATHSALALRSGCYTQTMCACFIA